MPSPETFTLRREENGFACAIDCRGVTVLHLQPGTERNELSASAGLIEFMLEALNAMEPERIEKILQAVDAYRFIDS
jgi:hypothetical protein